MNKINTLIFSFFIFFSFLAISQKVGAMEEDPSSSRRTRISSFSSFSSSEEQPLSEEMEVEVSKEIKGWKALIPCIDIKLRDVDDNVDVLLKEAKQLGFSGAPLPHVLLDNKKLREYAIGQVRKRKREDRIEKEGRGEKEEKEDKEWKEDKENKPNRENSIKRNKTQEMTVPHSQEELNVPSQKGQLEKN